jgi:hypothetical protein
LAFAPSHDLAFAPSHDLAFAPSRDFFLLTPFAIRPELVGWLNCSVLEIFLVCATLLSQ